MNTHFLEKLLVLEQVCARTCLPACVEECVYVHTCVCVGVCLLARLHVCVSRVCACAHVRDCLRG